MGPGSDDVVRLGHPLLGLSNLSISCTGHRRGLPSAKAGPAPTLLRVKRWQVLAKPTCAAMIRFRAVIERLSGNFNLARPATVLRQGVYIAQLGRSPLSIHDDVANVT